MNKGIRKAVGAIVIYDNKYLLVNKIYNSSEGKSVPERWDFPKGGLIEGETTDQALMRELLEETGTDQYEIIHRYDHQINFDFGLDHPYKKQETTMYCVKYLGLIGDLKCDGLEIDELDFFTKEEVLSKIELEETQEFLKENKW